jgi:hypothetical protein
MVLDETVFQIIGGYFLIKKRVEATFTPYLDERGVDMGPCGGIDATNGVIMSSMLS